MPAYLVSMINITNPEKYKDYTRVSGAIVAQYGGKFLARGGERAVMEGGLDYARVVIVEFPSMQAAKTFYNSPEYSGARAKRAGAADFNVVITEGI